MKPVIDPIDLGVYWSRLVAITAEAATAFRRAAFSSIVTESQDFAVALFNAQGELVAQPNAGFAAFAGTLSRSVPRIIAEVDGEIAPGDVYFTNDAWTGAGQLNDYFFVTPIHHDGTLIAFAATVAHSQDVGGSGQLSTRSRDIYSEGLQIPVSRFVVAGKINEPLVRLISRNVRNPELVVGDFFSQVASNNVMANRLIEFLPDLRGIPIEQFFAEILNRAERAMRDAVRRLPDGDYRAEIEEQAPDGTFQLKVGISIQNGEMNIDFTGSSEQSPYAINCTENFAVGRALAPLVSIASPGGYINGGSYRNIRMHVPKGSIINANYPAATSSRLFSSGLIAPLLLEALALISSDRGIAGCAAPVWGPAIVGSTKGRSWSRTMLLSGGMGARPTADGVSCLNYPDAMTSIRPEATEEDLPVQVIAQELMDDSGGSGAQRGGLGQRFVLKSKSEEPFRLSLRSPRLKSRPKGLMGGGPGAVGRIFINGIEKFDGTEDVILNPGDVVEFRSPGGGGYGPPANREATKLQNDVLEGKVSPSTAKAVYGMNDAPDARMAD